jgi:hypothetical protein
MSVAAFTHDITRYIADKFPEASKVSIWTDGPASQYKNRYTFAFLVKLSQMFPQFEFQWSFFATAHGKGPNDALGGRAKRHVANLILTRKMLVKNAEDFANAMVNTNIKTTLMSEHDIKETCDALGMAELWSNTPAVPGINNTHCISPANNTILCRFTNSCDVHRVVQLLSSAANEMPHEPILNPVPSASDALPEAFDPVVPPTPDIIVAVTDDLPTIPDDLPAVPSTSDEVPAVNDDVPAVPDDVPAVRDDVPAVPDDVPTVRDDVPAVSDDVPDDMPDVPDDMPDDVPPVPDVPDDVPAVSDGVPAVPDDLPAIPGNPPAVPSTSDDVPDVSDDLSAALSTSDDVPNEKGARNKRGKKRSQHKPRKKSPDVECFVCDGMFSESTPGEIWIQCNKCKKWAHEDCTAYEGGQQFECDSCIVRSRR